MNVTRNLKENCVRGKIMRQGKIYQRYFTLHDFGSWSKAEAAAKAWVRAQLAVLPRSTGTSGLMTKKNRSGVVGVYRSPGLVRRPNGKVYESPKWIAHWPGCPLHGGLSWSVKEFDEDGAFALAYLGRREQSVDRDRVFEELEKILETAEFEEICAKRKM